MTQTDVQLAGVLPLVLSRTHVSSYRVGRWFGPSWASTLDQRLEVDGEGVWFASADGMLLRFPVPPAGGEPVWPVVGPRLSLVATMHGYEVSDAARGYTWRFVRPGGETAAGVRSWPLTSMGDRNGNRIDLEYDEAEMLTGVRHSGGYHIRVDTAGGRITGLSLGEQELVRFSYDDSRQLTQVYNSSGLPMVFDYDVDGRMISWTDRIGGWYRYDYDSSGRCVRTTGAEGVLECRIAYDEASRTTSVTDSLGHIRRYVLNQARQIVQEIDPLGRETTQQWDQHRRLLSRTDPLGRTTSYTYDDDGNLVEVVHPGGGRATATYTDLRLPSTVTDPTGGVRQYEYDQRGNLLAVTDPTGATTRYSYGPIGSVATAIDPLGNTYRVDSDGAGLPLRITDPTGAVTRYERDAFGRPVTMVDPVGGTTRIGWTIEGLPAWRSLPGGATERWRYDDDGHVVEHIDPTGKRTQFEIGQFGLPTSRTESDGTQFTFDYDAELRLASVTNPQDLVWRYTYDPAGQLVAETDFNGLTIDYAYDQTGQLIARSSGAGESTQYIRDLVGNVVEQRSGEDVATFAYDALGRLTHARNRDADLSFTRDSLGRVVTETCNGEAVVSQFDPSGRRTRRTTPSGAEATWTYDSRGMPASLHTAGHTMWFEHDPAGREVRRQINNAVAVAQSWDPANRLIAQSLAVSSIVASDRADTTQPLAFPSQTRRWEYRVDGRLIGMYDSRVGQQRFGLDVAGRVTSVDGTGWSERYAYDRAGNLTGATWPSAQTANPIHLDARGDREYAGTLVRRAGEVRYEHDDRGRITLRQHKQLSGKPRTWHYRWDDQDHLVSVTTPEGQEWWHRYDPLGRRIAKQRLGPDGVVVEELRYTWDGPVLAEQVHHRPVEPGAPVPARITTVWDWWPGAFRPLTQAEYRTLRDAPQEIIDQRFYAIVTNHIGTPTELITEDGQVAWQHRQNLWGSTVTATGTADCPLRFPGQYYDPESGTHYNLYRHYDPAAARYQSPDPLGLAPAPNPHTYASNPHQQTDPLGLQTCGTGAGPTDPPIRYPGPWTRQDIVRGSLGLRPNSLGGGTLEIHHADQMPGSPIHELPQNVHRGPGTDLHRNPYNQGVTPEMRRQDTQLHWWYRSQEQGWGVYPPSQWFDNWPTTPDG